MPSMSNQLVIKSDLTVEKLNYQSVCDLLIDRLNTDSHQTCIIDCSLEREWTKRQILNSSLNFAAYLIQEFNVKKGDAVCFAVNNSDLHGIGILGVLIAGAVYCSFQEHLPEFEIINIVKKIKPAVLICSDRNYEFIKNVLNKYNNKNNQNILLIDIESKSQINSNVLSVEEIFNRKCLSHIRLPVPTGPNDLATYIMTSGSTGQPKIILKTNGNYLASIEALQHKDVNLLTSDDRMMANGFCHLSGQLTIFSAIVGGAQLAINRNDKEPGHIFDIINKYQLTVGLLIPTQLNFLAKNYEKYNKNYLKSLKNVIFGGAQVSESSFNTIVREYGFEKFSNGYGMSEVGMATLTPSSECKNLKYSLSVGKMIPLQEVVVIDDQENLLGPNQHGEICFRGPQVTPGYLDNELENSKLFTSDGFLKSGDIGYYDENRFFYIVGRIKDIIIVDATKIYPTELEEILQKHPDVENAAVIGVKHKIHNEVPMAFVKLIKGSTATEQEIIDYFNSKVNYYKKLRAGLKILDSFPMTSINKINKPELRRMFATNC